MADGEIILGVDIDVRQAEEKIQRLIKELTNLKIEEQNNSGEMRQLAREAGKFQRYIQEAKEMLEKLKPLAGKILGVKILKKMKLS